MIGKYTLRFNDAILENIFQTYMTTCIRAPLFKKVILSSFLLIISNIVQKNLEEGPEVLKHELALLKFSFWMFLEIFFILIYRFRQQYIKYALLFYNHILLFMYASLENYTTQQRQLYSIGIFVFQTVNIMFGEFWEGVYQTVGFGSIYLILAFYIDRKIDITILTMMIAAITLLISALYANIKALRSQFQLGKLDNQWELIFQATVQNEDYIVFNYDDKNYSFNLSQPCKSENINTTQELRNLLRNIQTTQKLSLEQELFRIIQKNQNRINILNQEVSVISLQQRQILYSIFYGFNTIILIQFRQYNQVQKKREQFIERSYQKKYQQFLLLMIKLAKQFQYNKNSPKVICKFRKFCLYAHLKNYILEEGSQFSESLISQLQFNKLMNILQSLYQQKKISYDNNIQQVILGVKQRILLILIEIIEISLSYTIHFRFEKAGDSLTVKVYCQYNERSIIQFTKRINFYFPFLLKVQYEFQYISVEFKSNDTLCIFN